MGKIKQLSKNLINQIAAGEVIERPASVVKELVENSIDANASKISIDISNDCRNIRVADNGYGIVPEDIPVAFIKHATSKIETTDDLENIMTLGFRGEALASIISIANVTCISRTADYDYGTKAVCENSEVETSKTGCAVGTIMDIKNLFYNTPVRLKFLKSAKTEFAYIHDIVRALCISHPEISFTLKNNDKTVIKTTGNGDLKTVITDLFGSDILKYLKPVEKTDDISSIKITGFVTTPDYTRSTKKDYYLYVNSRIVKCPVLQKAIDISYKFLTGKYPFVILNLEIPADSVDVNVHPTKREIRYKNTNQIFAFVNSAVSSGLMRTENNFANKFQPKTETFEEKESEINDFGNNFVYTFSEEKQDNNIYNNRDESKYFSQQNYFLPQEDFKSAAPEQYKLVEDVKENEELIIGQYAKTYILIERPEGLEIVDQHIADERYIYEQLKSSKQNARQLLFLSDVISLSATDAQMVKENLDKFNRIGFEIEFVSENEIIFRSVPQLLSKTDLKEVLADILNNAEMPNSDLEEKIIITSACKSAVKANTKLNLFQMQEIIKHWRECKNPETCPHGRPISKIIPHKQLAGFFERTK